MKRKPKSRVCSVAETIEIMGDKWVFFILREAFFGVKTYEKFQENLGIATNILSARLKALVKNEIFERQKNPEDGRRFIYKLTPKGLDLYPVIIAMMNWGDRWIDWQDGPPLLLFHEKCGKPLEAVMRCAHCGDPVDVHEISYKERFPFNALDIEADTNKSKT